MRNRGLTLVELMLSFGVAAISVLLIFEMITAGLAHYRKLDTIGTTQSLAEAKMEEVVATYVGDLANASGDFPAPHQDWHYEVAVLNHGPAEIKDVTVTVNHKGGTRRSLATVRAPNSTPRGMRLFFQYDCNSCHRVTGVAESADLSLGPDLTNAYLEDKPYLENSVLNPDDDIKDPNLYALDTDGDGNPDMPLVSQMSATIAPGAIPPDEAQALAEWLYSLGP